MSRCHVRTLLILLMLLPLIAAALYCGVHRRLHRQVERTKAAWPVGEKVVQPVANEEPPKPESWRFMAAGWCACVAFLATWYWMLRKSQSLHPRTRGYPSYGPHMGGSQL
jgi:hypothetical protein